MSTVRAYKPDAGAVAARLDDVGAALLDARERTRASIDLGIDTIKRALEDGVPVNVTDCARRMGIARATVYNRLPDELALAARVDEIVAERAAGAATGQGRR